MARSCTAGPDPCFAPQSATPLSHDSNLNNTETSRGVKACHTMLRVSMVSSHYSERKITSGWGFFYSPLGNAADLITQFTVQIKRSKIIAKAWISIIHQQGLLETVVLERTVERSLKWGWNRAKLHFFLKAAILQPLAVEPYQRSLRQTTTHLKLPITNPLFSSSLWQFVKLKHSAELVEDTYRVRHSATSPFHFCNVHRKSLISVCSNLPLTTMENEMRKLVEVINQIESVSAIFFRLKVEGF